MEELLIGSSVLILFVILLRAVMGRRISFRMRYALWLIVALRLALPFALPGSSFSIMNYVPSPEAVFGEQTESSGYAAGNGESMAVGEYVKGLPAGEAGESVMLSVRQGAALVQLDDGTAGDSLGQNAMSLLSGDNLQNASEPYGEFLPQGTAARRKAEMWKNRLFGIWLTGAAAMSLYLLIVNMLWYRRLRRTRVLVEPAARAKDGRTPPVYRCAKLASPCLFGVWRPAIYLNDTALAGKKNRAFTLAHEQQHYRHKDHIWSFIRLLCLTVYWFHPLVWAAGILSARDCELACDEGVTARITEEDCAEYGRCLLGQIPLKHGGMRLTATSMSGSARALKRRLLAITQKKKASAWAVFITAVMLLLVSGCTFTGADDRSKDTGNNSTNGSVVESSGDVNGADGNTADKSGAGGDGMDGTGGSSSDENGLGEPAQPALPEASAEENRMQTALRAFTMFPDERHGWAVTEDDQILYTYEGDGQFSFLASLPFAQAQAVPDTADGSAGFLADTDGARVSVCFIDEKTACFAGVSAYDGEALFIRETILSEPAAGEEGGQVLVSEHRTRIPLEEYYWCGNTFLSFADSQNGYLLVCSDPALGQMAKHLYCTTDGGDSFSFMADVSDVISGYPTGMAFCSENVGYIGVSHRHETSYLYGTTDGGKTWESVDVPVHADAYYADSIAPVVFYEEGMPQMAVVLKSVGPGERIRFVLYENPRPADFATWQLIRILPYEEVRSYSLLDGDTGYFIDGDGTLQKWKYDGP